MENFKLLLILLAILTSLGCTVLLFRSYFAARASLLLWSGLCFIGLAINNIALFVDLVMLPEVDLRVVRLSAALVGMLFMIYGFISEAD